MSARISEDGWIDYRCHREEEGAPDAKFRYRPNPEAESQEAKPGTLEFFLLERYWLYAHNQKRKRLLKGQVKHTPYRYGEAQVETLDQRPIAISPQLNELGAPDHICTAEDVSVSILGFPSRV